MIAYMIILFNANECWIVFKIVLQTRKKFIDTIIVSYPYHNLDIYIIMNDKDKIVNSHISNGK